MGFIPVPRASAVFVQGVVRPKLVPPVVPVNWMLSDAAVPTSSCTGPAAVMVKVVLGSVTGICGGHTDKIATPGRVDEGDEAGSIGAWGATAHEASCVG